LLAFLLFKHIRIIFLFLFSGLYWLLYRAIIFIRELLFRISNRLKRLTEMFRSLSLGHFDINSEVIHQVELILRLWQLNLNVKTVVNNFLASFDLDQT
jgi:hypothetical protein